FHLMVSVVCVAEEDDCSSSNWLRLNTANGCPKANIINRAIHTNFLVEGFIAISSQNSRAVTNLPVTWRIKFVTTRFDFIVLIFQRVKDRAAHICERRQT